MTPVAWVLYDGACGFCSRWVPFWKGTLAKRRIGIATLQERWVGARLAAKGVAADERLDDLRVLVDATGEVVSGADAYRWCFRRIWWAKPLWVLSVAPGCRRLFERAYRTFAENRYRVSSACRLDGSSPRERPPGA